MKTLLGLLILSVAAWAQTLLPSPTSGGAGGGGGSGCVPAGTVGHILVDSGTGACNTTTPSISGSTITASLTGAASLNLLISNNLSDLASAATARANLGGVVVGPASSTTNDCAAFADTTGKLLKDVACGGGSGPGGATNTLQKNNGSGGFAASSVTDNGTTVSTTEPFQAPSVCSGGGTCPALTAGTGGATASPEGTAPSVCATSGVDCVYADSTAHALLASYNNGSFLRMPLVIASGTSSLGTGSISSATCATVVTTSATGTLSTDAIIWNPNGSIKAVTGYVPATTGGLSIAAYPTADNVNFDVCNWSSGSLTPGAVTINWRVVR
jgi:hypothetical protein